MKGKLRSWWIWLCGALAALAIIAGVGVVQPTVEASANTTTPIVTMFAGASTRKTVGSPGIKFEATIDNYDKSYDYGMLILPEAAWDKFGWTWGGEEDYIGDLETAGVTYARKDKCNVYMKDGRYCYSFSLTEILPQNYTLSFVGLAYTTAKDGTRTYATVDQIDNARSIAYVAQMALKYEDNLTIDNKNILTAYSNPGVIIDKEDHTDVDTNADITPDNYAMQYIFNASGESVSQVTKTAYAGGSTVSFKYYIAPNTTSTRWWGLAWSTKNTDLDIYAAADANKAKQLDATVGEWVSVSFTLPSGGPYYLYFGSEVGNWKLSDGSNAWALIDDFKVGSTTESFSADSSKWILSVLASNAVQPYCIEKGGIFIGAYGDYSAKIIVDKINSAVGTASFITKKAYPAGSEVSFMYYVPSDVTSSWFAVCEVTDPTNTDIYSNWLWQGNLIKGSWQKMTLTMTKTAYIHFAGAVGDWGGKDTPKTEGYVLIDDFTVDGQTENFNKGVSKNAIFNVNNPNAIVDGDGYVVVPDKTDYMLSFEGSAIGGNEYIAMVTDKGYASVSEITFKAVWTGKVTSARWGLSYTTDPTKFSYGDEVSAINCYTPKLGNLMQDAGVVYIYKFTFANGQYTLYGSSDDGLSFAKITSGSYTEGANYFYIMLCPAVSGTGAAFYMDDFSITYGGKTVVDTFADKNSTLFVESSSFNSHYGSTGMSIVKSTMGKVEEESPEVEYVGEKGAKIYGDKISGTKTTPTFITAEKYTGGVTVTFRYYMSGNTNKKWWTLGWTTDQKSANIYAGVSSSDTTETNSAKSLSTSTQDAWTTATVELPAGEWYLYFGMAKGEWSGGYVIIDDFKIGDTVIETFNYGLDDSIFLVTPFDADHPDAVELAEGFKPAELGAKIWMKKISSTKTTPTFITKQKYSGGVTVTFDYYMSGNTNNHWWMFGWTNNAGVASIYAHAEDNKENNDGKDLPKVQDSWQTVKVDIPAGEWYFYFAGNKPDCDSTFYVIVDNFQIGDVVTETFNYGIAESIFGVRSSHASAIETADGKELFVPGEHSAKLDFSNSFDNNGKTFITKQAIATGGSIVSFKYMIPSETTVGDWWAICYTTDASNPNFWAVGNGLAAGGGGVNPNPNKYKGQGWVEYSFTLPDDGNNYYLYFTGYQNWSGYVYIDDFQVISKTGIYQDDFTNGAGGGLFTVNNANYVSYGEGYIADKVKGDYAAKIEVDKMSSSNSFLAMQKFEAGSVVTFDYFIPSDVTFKTNGTWWTLCVTDNPLSTSVYSNHYATLPKVQGSWQTVSYTINKAGYIYFGGAIGEWNGGCVYIDNFSVTTNGVTVTEDFTNGFGLFMATSNAVTMSEMPQLYTDAWSLEYMLANGSILDTLVSGGYAYIKLVGALQATGLPTSMLMVEGSIEYSVNGEKQFAIYFGNEYYLAVTATSIALYKDTTMISEMPFTAVSGETNTVSISVTAGGKVLVKVGNDYVGLGMMENLPTEVKVVALGGDGSLLFGKTEFVTYVLVESLPSDIPTYFPTESIDFTAYAFDSNAMVSDAGYQLLADAGFTKTLALLQGRLTSGDLHETDIPNVEHVNNLMEEVNKDAIAALMLAEKYGMKHYVLNSNVYNLERNPNNYQWIDEFAAASYEEYSNVIIDGVTQDLSQAFAGYFFADEPKASFSFSGDVNGGELKELVNAYRAYKKAFPNSELFINLLPNDSSNVSSNYEAYVQYYVDNIAKDVTVDGELIKGTGYVSYDQYPLKTNTINAQHLRNLEIVANICRDNGLELRAYIKASEKGDSSRSLRATQSVNDLYVQIYSALAFGAKEITYYQFTDHTNTDSTTAGDGVINGSTLDTSAPVYGFAKKVNNEVHALEAAYMSFKWDSVSTQTTGFFTSFRNLKNAVTIGTHGCLTSVSTSSTSTRALIGNFTDKDGKYSYGAQHAYMVINYGNTSSVSTGTITLTFSGKTRALVYQQGVMKVETLSSNKLSLSLTTGEGAFVIPFN